MKVFFATDIHGSEICWRKFLNAAAFYKADMVILGGDVTGKVLVPILAMPGYWEVSFGGQRMRLETKTELDEIQRKIRDRGSYPSVMAPDELDALTQAKQLHEVAETVPKGLKWKTRARVGDRVRWYELPEEVDH